MRRISFARADERAVAPVIAEVLLVAMSVTLAATLFVVVSQITSEATVGPTKPLVFFTPADLARGNATVRVGGTSVAMPASDYRVVLMVDDTPGGPIAIGPSGTPTTSAEAGATYGITWTDVGGRGLLAGGDSFLVTGGTAPLPLGHAYRLALLWTDGSAIASVSWST